VLALFGPAQTPCRASATNESGTLHEPSTRTKYAYDSFGFLTNSTGSATNWFRYTARQFDSETALYNYRARYYDPTSGRFLSEDPVGFSGGANFYSYVGNSANNYADPSGFSPAPCLDVNKFLKWLDDHAHDNSTGNCAKYVRSGLQAGGLNTNGHPTDAKDYGPFLLQLGFVVISQSGYAPQSGDIVVIQPGPTPSGHIQAWDGNQWVSDFKQGSRKISPYKGDLTPSFSIYRFSHPCP
jgi:RHS repeat-associated protein